MQPGNQVPTGMVLAVAHDCDAASVGSDGLAFRNRLSGVVRPFGMDVGFERAEDAVHRRLIEKEDIVDRREC